MRKTIIVSNRLPVKITRKNEEIVLMPSEGGLATGLGSVYREGSNVWIGWPGQEVSDLAEQEELTTALGKLNLLPVYLTAEEINQFYEGFSNEVLWPVFHYMSTYARYEQSYWDYYMRVNEKFKEAVLAVAEPGDVIWVQDYQLLLLPGLLRTDLPDASIGFFQHIPFPSYELFRLIPWREELLNGILGADLIGFHTFDDARHFIGSCVRLLAFHASANTITVNDRNVMVETFPMGIDNRKFESLSATAGVQNQVQVLGKRFQQMRIILSIDRLDYSKGILQRLQGFDLFLQNHPEYVEKVGLAMIIVPSRDTVPQYKELRDQIDQLVGNINARYRTMGWSPIHYFYRSFPLDILTALYNLADICLVTPMRDGMNLVAKEYVASRIHNNGVLILSEMAGASKELIDAIVVNPNNTNAIAEAIAIALSMPLTEQQQRMKAMRQMVAKFNVYHWVKLFMTTLDDVKKAQQSMQARRISPGMAQEMVHDYVHAGKRALFLDYDGTLVDFNVNREDANPDPDLYKLLNNLASDPQNQLVLISGRHHTNLEQWFGELPIDLIAEHGAWHKLQGGAWTQIPGLTDQWKAEIQPILETFTDRTPGALIEEKSFSLVWHYRKVEEGLGDLRANELMDTLRYYIADKPLQLLPGDKVIEIKNVEINKGKAALAWMKDETFDFILGIGDDFTDEDIFKVLPANAYTIKVGNYVSAARYYLRSFREVRQLLKMLVQEKNALKLQ
ncbi:trehalose 6-phosphate synthase /trehalose 6-phosphatase [Chitinophaga costaii]|uniref:Trehalose 6-phosphate synthase /trehalose 6-phosphatase n=1 Tax=Chitinophaga costaii TaxID=1335309 RepID=A0A1C4G3R6_9BACT|nr:bifunctional alpha,alpha-trehalose-phosphate synthase (UDP-forming)/trehalose-phosphatase [Chitinophaga costaii]PUZ20982.1 bifunctional alpha,alpha-trehalose-phosphate synthase (UDP-forming)/trehalose-phosphatase [Chitinophaga costaii]SCC62764.1 trehalose 6-phosphate synthase /trehalose 6-phosphatase [Chitinophaga costaii]